MARQRNGILIPIELHEAVILLKALHEYRNVDPPRWGDNELESLIQRVMAHIGYPTSKKVVPEVYKAYYPDGPPKITPWW